MLNSHNYIKFHNAGIQADMAGQRLSVGDVVLFKGYCSGDKNAFAKIIKVNKKTVVLEHSYQAYHYGSFVPKPRDHKGSWNYYPNAQGRIVKTKVKRPGYATLKLSPSCVEEIKANAAATIDAHPEILI